MADDSSRSDNLYVNGLKNAYAMEMEALFIMRPQVARIEHYPEVEAMLTEHIAETEQQALRPETLLDAYGPDKPTPKHMALSVARSMAAIGTARPTTRFKNAFANSTFENFEIASYRSLITLAKASGHADAALTLQLNLDEEEALADLVEGNLETLTQKFVSLSGTGATANK